jgi:hypothetical protein
MDILALLG